MSVCKPLWSIKGQMHFGTILWIFAPLSWPNQTLTTPPNMHIFLMAAVSSVSLHSGRTCTLQLYRPLWGCLLLYPVLGHSPIKVCWAAMFRQSGDSKIITGGSGRWIEVNMHLWMCPKMHLSFKYITRYGHKSQNASLRGEHHSGVTSLGFWPRDIYTASVLRGILATCTCAMLACLSGTRRIYSEWVCKVSLRAPLPTDCIFRPSLVSGLDRAHKLYIGCTVY